MIESDDGRQTMRLVLTVVSEDGPDLGSRSRCEFDQKGGTIGRNSHCHWSLPDPTNTISARHAVVAHNGLGFLITDMSTNGVFLNKVDAPLGRGNDATLRDGDTLYLGHYVVAVEVVDERPSEPTRAGWPAESTAPNSPIQAPAGFGSAEQAHSPIDDLLASRPNTSDRQMPPIESPRAQRGAPSPGAAPWPAIEDLFGASQSRTSSPAPSGRPGAAAPGFGSGAPGGSRIPDDFLSDLLGPAGAAPLSPLSANPPSPLAGPSGWRQPAPSPEPKPSQPPPPAVAQPPEERRSPAASVDTGGSTAPVAVAPDRASGAPLPGEGRRSQSVLAKPLYDDLVTLRQPGRDAPDGGPALDPVAILRRRGQAGSNRSAESPADEPAATPPSPIPSPAAPRSQRAMPLPGARSASSGVASPAAARGGSPAPASAAGSSAAASFWSALGIDRPNDPATEAVLMAELGGALRAALNGIVPVLAGRRSLKDAMRMDQTQLQGQDNNPLKFLPSGDVVLQSLVSNKLGGFLPLTDAVRQGFDDIRAHEVAAVVALGAVARNVLDRLAPETIEAAGGSTKLFGRGADKSKLWDHYVAAHGNLAGASDETTRKVVNQEFSRAYGEQVRAAQKEER